MMLSRAAERVYWLGRYLERAENTARVVQQYSQLLLDLPDGTGLEWFELVRIFGAKAAFAEQGRSNEEQDILAFLLSENTSANSLLFSLRMARENLRNTRDLLPHESWESVNELYLYARSQLPSLSRSEDRFEVLSQCISRCQQVNGVLVGTMSHHSPLQFLRMGQNIERADMTSRIIDVAAHHLAGEADEIERYRSTLWTNVLKSVSGFQMYRQYVQIPVAGPQVIKFLLNDTAFPRAIRRCVDEASSSAGKLPASDMVIACLAEVRAGIDQVPSDIDALSVQRLMDELQRDLGRVHNAVAESWFLIAA